MQIFSGIGQELTMLGEALLMGAAMFALYDLIRVLRRMFSHGIIWISLEDFFFWLVSAGWFFLRVGKLNNGIIRFYVILGMLLGALLYYRIFSRHLMRYIERFIGFLKKQLKKIHKAATMKLVRHEEARKKHEREEEKKP